MVPSFLEAGARTLVMRFLQRFIVTGCLILVEEEGSIFTFEGSKRKSSLKVALKIQNPQFYWKVVTEAELGFADAYINGDFSFVDKNEGLVNFFLIIIASKELNAYSSKLNKRRGWWTPLLYTSAIASARYFFKHVSTKNTLSMARQNTSLHYDLSNELFSLFMDETMAYSCAIFKSRIKKEHHILEIGFGWGSLALEVVKITGCKYTGVTLSENQLQYVESKVKEAGLQDQIELLLCDYRKLPNNCKYERIISIEMIEHVGHEFMDEYFKSCESALAKNGLLVPQFIAMADDKYDESRLSQGFIREYIFQGSCIPSLSRVISAMAAGSRLSVVHLEEIGNNYFDTLRHWRQNFLKNQGLARSKAENIIPMQRWRFIGGPNYVIRTMFPGILGSISEILELGFDEKFIRTWEYYFDYCAAGFKYCILGNYQIVFSRPGDVAAFGNNPYNPPPFAY